MSHTWVSTTWTDDWITGGKSHSETATEIDTLNKTTYSFSLNYSSLFRIYRNYQYLDYIPGGPPWSKTTSGTPIYKLNYGWESATNILFGTIRDLNNSFAITGAQKTKLKETSPDGKSVFSYVRVRVSTIGGIYNHTKQKAEPPEPPKTPITPPEKDDMSCCDLEPVLSMLRKMNKVLAIDEMDGEGVKIPKRLFVPQGKGYEECKTYSHLFATQVRIQDHLGIHPFKAELADSNAAQAGNQKMSIQVINATAFAKLQSELLLENKSDSATRLNLLVRNTVAVGQILNGVTIAAKRAREIMRFLSIPVKETIDHINMPFDFSFGNRDKKKGFQAGAKPAEALDINTEEATEAMLPKFMVNSKQPYVIEIFDDKQGTLLDILLKQNK